jgi:hypothetical protein
VSRRNSPVEPLPPRGGGGSEFVLSPKLAESFWQLAKIIRAAAPSEQLHAFTTFARSAANLVHPNNFPKKEVVDRVWAAAGGAGLVRAYGEDLLQQLLSEAFSDHTLTGFDPLSLNIETAGMTPPRLGGGQPVSGSEHTEADNSSVGAGASRND